MKHKYSAKITYKIDSEHPDYECISPKKRNGTLDYSDVYTLDDDYYYGTDDMLDYMKEDLLLIAGGGYNWKHVHDVKFDIREI